MLANRQYLLLLTATLVLLLAMGMKGFSPPLTEFRAAGEGKLSGRIWEGGQCPGYARARQNPAQEEIGLYYVKLRDIKIGDEMIHQIRVRYYHKYLVYINRNGHWFGWRTGPGQDWLWLWEVFDSEIGDDSGNFGQLTIRTNPYAENEFRDFYAGNVDDNLENDQPYEILLQGKDLSSYWQKIITNGQKLHAAYLPFKPLSKNSNAALDTILLESGVPQSQCDDFMDATWAPGSGVRSDIPDDFFSTFAVPNDQHQNPQPSPSPPSAWRQ